MWLTTLSFVCCLSAINRVDAAPVDSVNKAAVNNSVQINFKFPNSTISVM
jgi:hypothetical protein